MEVIKYLNENGVAALMSEFDIKVREYPEEGIMILNYNMIESPKHHPIVRECRSLILQNVEPYNVVSRSFTRFFNFGECQESDIFDFRDAVYWEKVDGSIINVYWWNDKWNVSTKSMAMGEAETALGFKFADIFKSVFDINSIPVEYRGKTLIFEMVSPKTRVVKPYPTDDVYLLAVRGTDGYELNYSQVIETANILGIKVPRTINAADHNSLLSVIKELDAFDEGFVGAVYNGNLNNVHRIKFKNPSYLAISNLRGEGILSVKRMVLLVFAQDQEEYLSYFPEDRVYFEPYIEAFDRFIVDVKQLFDKYGKIEDRKEFALSIESCPAKHILFQMKFNGRTIQEVVDRLTDNSKLSIIENYLKK